MPNSFERRFEVGEIAFIVLALLQLLALQLLDLIAQLVDLGLLAIELGEVLLVGLGG